TYSGNVFRLEQHINRLYESAHSIMLNIPYEKKELEEAIVSTVRKNNLSDAYIRVVVSRGAGNLGLDPRACSNPRVIIIAEALAIYPKEAYENGLKIISVASRRN